MNGFDEITRIARALSYTRQTDRLLALKTDELVKLVRACWASDWDVYPDALSDVQIAAILAGTLVAPQFEETARGLRPVDPPEGGPIECLVILRDDGGTTYLHMGDGDPVSGPWKNAAEALADFAEQTEGLYRVVPHSHTGYASSFLFVREVDWLGRGIRARTQKEAP